MIRSLNALYDARRGRFHAAEEGLPPILWWNLIAGAGLTILFSCLFGVPNFPMHMAMVAMLAASIALVLSLIILLDNPFRGQNHVSAAPFERLVRTVEDMAYPKENPAGIRGAHILPVTRVGFNRLVRPHDGLAPSPQRGG